MDSGSRPLRGLGRNDDTDWTVRRLGRNDSLCTERATGRTKDSMMNLDPILSETLDAATKGYPLSGTALPISAIGAQRWSVLAGDMPLPLAVIRDSALAHNQAWMRDFTASTGVLLAPHGKTTMAPQIFAQQLAAGAWGITVANVQQLGICVRFGVRR